MVQRKLVAVVFILLCIAGTADDRDFGSFRPPRESELGEVDAETKQLLHSVLVYLMESTPTSKDRMELGNSLFAVIEGVAPRVIDKQILGENVYQAHPIKLELLRAFKLFLMQGKLDIKAGFESLVLRFLPKLYGTSGKMSASRKEKITEFVDLCLRQYRGFADFNSIRSETARVDLLTALFLQVTTDNLVVLSTYIPSDQVDKYIDERTVEVSSSQRQLLSILFLRPGDVAPELSTLTELSPSIAVLSDKNRLRFMAVWDELVVPTHMPQATAEGLARWLEAKDISLSPKQSEVLLRAFRNLKSHSVDPIQERTTDAMALKPSRQWFEAAYVLMQVPFIRDSATFHLEFNFFPSEKRAWEELREAIDQSTWNLYKRTGETYVRLLILPTRPEFARAQFVSEVFRCRFEDAMQLDWDIATRNKDAVRERMFELLKGVSLPRLHEQLEKVQVAIGKPIELQDVSKKRDESGEIVLDGGAPPPLPSRADVALLGTLVEGISIALEAKRSPRENNTPQWIVRAPVYLNGKEILLRELRSFDASMAQWSKSLSKAIRVSSSKEITLALWEYGISEKHLPILFDLVRINLANSNLDQAARAALAVVSMSNKLARNYTWKLRDPQGGTFVANEFLGVTFNEVMESLKRLDHTYLNRPSDPAAPTARVSDAFFYYAE